MRWITLCIFLANYANAQHLPPLEVEPEPIRFEWNIDIQYSRTDTDEGSQFVWAQIPGAPRQDCPDGNCPVYPNSVPIGQLQLPKTVLDIDGDGQEGTANDYRMHLERDHGISVAPGASIHEMNVAHMQAHGDDPGQFGAPVVPYSTQTNVPMYSVQSAQRQVYGFRGVSGQFRPYGSFGDGQGWWIGKVLGRPMPLRKARRRGY